MSNSILLKIAKDAIEEELYNKSKIDRVDLEASFDFLNEQRACFVTLKLEDRLRGCIGSLLPDKKLIDDVIANAQNAAFRDFRFQPLSKKEFEKVEVEISLLTIPKMVIYDSIDELKEKIRPNIDGVILKQEQNKATFLPQVWDELPNFDDFFENLSLKAGLDIGSLTHFPEIFTYQVEKVK
ncbi:MAG: AmmeMemoRadiSam system protein A [Arcobacter sp.]|uniref:AmmeMemoRadiSam system protein A n=1 Tax=Arcobacter sp. TaxID=1872629 RepID=UPI003B00D14D